MSVKTLRASCLVSQRLEWNWLWVEVLRPISFHLGSLLDLRTGLAKPSRRPLSLPLRNERHRYLQGAQKKTKR